jgi:hypothetical protein
LASAKALSIAWRRRTGGGAPVLVVWPIEGRFSLGSAFESRARKPLFLCTKSAKEAPRGDTKKG